jgi:hypothetical protein
MKTYSEEEISEYYEDEPEAIICPFCEKRGYRILLGPKILQPNEPRPADYESWLECPTSYAVIPIHEIPKEETINDILKLLNHLLNRVNLFSRQCLNLLVQKVKSYQQRKEERK